MVPPTPTPSARLLEAAAAERDALAGHRDRLVAARERLRAELAAVERSLEEVDERSDLLLRLTGGRDADVRRGSGELVANTARPMEECADAEPQRTMRVAQTGPIRPADRPGGLLRGPAIRRAAVEVLLAQADRPEALHYRDWFDLVRAAGFDVAGKDPLAVFLTQLSRSPVIRRGTQAGVYELDVTAPARLGIALDRLHEDLRGLTARPEATADLAAIRARREQLTLEINQTEKALEEAEATLAAGGAIAAFATAS